MKKPSKQQQLIEEYSSILEICVNYTPEDLRNIADSMEDMNIEFVRIEGGFQEFVQGKKESDQEAEVRYKKEIKKWETWKKKEVERQEKQRQRLIKEAKKLGMTLEADK